MKKNHFVRYILITDVVWIAVAFFGAALIRYGLHWGSTQRIFTHSLSPFFFTTSLLWVFLSERMKLDGFREGWRFPAMVSALFLGVSLLMTVLLASSYLTRQYVSRLALGYFGILLLVGFVAIRYCARLILRARHRAGKVGRVVIIGTGQIAQELASKIARHPEMLCTVVGFLYPHDTCSDIDLSPPNRSCSTLSTLNAIDLLLTEDIDELMIALPAPSRPEILNLIGRCRGLGVNVSLVPQPYELYLSKPNLLDLGGLPILRLQEAAASDLFFQWKLVLDMFLGLLLSLLTVPLLAPAAIAVRLVQGRAFRWEVRSGKHGKPFFMLRLNVDRQGRNVTRFEQILLALSITELPQLFNVLRGDMSLVGPRPESPDRVRHYSPWQQQRLSVKPGMTGLAQVHGLREQHSSEEKTRFDLQYLLHPSPLSDVSLLLQTLWTLAMRVFRYQELSSLEASVSANKQITPEFRFPSVEEALHRAHRSQSSAD